ncbi:nucleotide excision repair, TFIIH, subunit TTDA isoform X1 [Carex rostrata]
MQYSFLFSLITWLFNVIEMVNAIKGIFISCDIPMAQFVVNLNNSMPANEKFIVHMLDSTHMFVQPHVEVMIRSKISEFRDQNSYEKPQ